jgi:hypothetical protein
MLCHMGKIEQVWRMLEHWVGKFKVLAAVS